MLQADLYNKLSQSKVIQEAALRSGIAKGAINAAWDAIGEVIKAWATEGHSVAVPGLGTMRFGLRSTSIADVNKVGSDLITTRRVIFTPNVEIKEELHFSLRLKSLQLKWLRSLKLICLQLRGLMLTVQTTQ